MNERRSAGEREREREGETERQREAGALKEHRGDCALPDAAMLPDERSIGGRKEVEAELRNMHKKILNARSTLQTRLDRQYLNQTSKARPVSAKSLTDRREVRWIAR